MIQFDTYITKHSKLSKFLFALFFLCFIILIFYPLILSHINGIFSIIILLIALAGTITILAIILLNGKCDFWEGIVRDGKIEFHDEHIKYHDEVIHYSLLKDIVFYYGGYPRSKEQIHVYRTGSYIKYSFNNANHQIYMIIEDEIDRKRLVEILKTLHEKGIKYSEKTCVGNSYFLEVNMNYKEIQQWKSKYGR